MDYAVQIINKVYGRWIRNERPEAGETAAVKTVPAPGRKNIVRMGGLLGICDGAIDSHFDISFEHGPDGTIGFFGEVDDFVEVGFGGVGGGEVDLDLD